MINEVKCVKGKKFVSTGNKRDSKIGFFSLNLFFVVFKLFLINLVFGDVPVGERPREKLSENYVKKN